MDKRLILSVLLVVLSWEFMPTYAETNTTVAFDSNITDNNTRNSNATDNYTTTEAPDTSMTNITTKAAPTNITTKAAPTNITTKAAPTNITTKAAPTNITTKAAPTNITTKAAPTNITTKAAPTNINTTVASVVIPAIVKSISQDGCGSSKLCVDKPSKCDPASGDCYFLSAKQQSDQTYNFQLSGQTEGYIAAGLSTDTNLNDSGIAYICANHKGHVRFFTGFFTNLVPNVTDRLNVTDMKGSVNASKIQCTFTAVLPATEKRAANYAMGIFTGPYNSSSGELGLSKSKTQTAVVVDLSKPGANLSDNSASFVYPVTHTHSFLPVLLATMCLLAFTAG